MKLSKFVLAWGYVLLCAHAMHAAKVVSATLGPVPGIAPLACGSKTRPNPVPLSAASISENSNFFTNGGIVNSDALNGGVDVAPCYVKQLVLTFDNGQVMTVKDGTNYTPPAYNVTFQNKTSYPVTATLTCSGQAPITLGTNITPGKTTTSVTVPAPCASPSVTTVQTVTTTTSTGVTGNDYLQNFNNPQMNLIAK